MAAPRLARPRARAGSGSRRSFGFEAPLLPGGTLTRHPGRGGSYSTPATPRGIWAGPRLDDRVCVGWRRRVNAQAEAMRDGRGLDPRVHPELSQDVRNVDARGLPADEQAIRDLLVCPAAGHQPEHLFFAWREAETHDRRDLRRFAGGRSTRDAA